MHELPGPFTSHYMFAWSAWQGWRSAVCLTRVLLLLQLLQGLRFFGVGVWVWRSLMSLLSFKALELAKGGKVSLFCPRISNHYIARTDDGRRTKPFSIPVEGWMLDVSPIVLYGKICCSRVLNNDVTRDWMSLTVWSRILAMMSKIPACSSVDHACERWRSVA